MSPEEVENYFKTLGMGEALVERGNAVVAEWSDVLPEPVDHVFVNEYRDEEGSRNYEELWILTNSYMSEAKNFGSVDHGDITRVDKGLARLEVARTNFDFSEASERSRMTVEILVAGSPGLGITGTFKASGENCAVLGNILRSYLIPLLATG